MTQRITLRDVAQYVGVSITTVSNVVRDWPYVADETRTKVQRAIVELGYSPHPIAQSLRTGTMQTIGFIVPDLANPYFASMVSVAEDVARDQQYTVIVFNSHEDEATEAECIRRANNRMVDGILISQVAEAKHTTERLKALSVPVVSIDRIPDDFDGASCTLNNFRAAEMATQHLAALGHQRIAHIGGPTSAAPGRDRSNGYLEALQQNGLDYHRTVYTRAGWGCNGGYAAMRQLLDDSIRPTAVFASNDRVAIGAFHAINDAGLRVPDDISVVGVDDIEVSEHITPPLTTVRQPLLDMARAGIDLLLTLVHEQEPEESHIVLEPSLILRQSTAPPV
jgi:DNA-binding LacI/PurR family transcriptional regulator